MYGLVQDCGNSNSRQWRYHILALYHRHNIYTTLQWRHNEHNGVSNQQLYDSLLNSLFMRRSKKTSKLRVTGLCEGNSPVTAEFSAQRASNGENVSFWWRLHEICMVRMKHKRLKSHLLLRPFLHGLTLIPAWISNYFHYKVWNEVKYQFPNLKGCTVEIWE